MSVRLLRRYPVLKTISAYMAINALADFNEQVLIKKRTRETYKYDKTARITVVGAFVVSPMVFAWMRFAEKLLPGRGFRVVMAKVVLDQLLAAPVEISTFYICTNILEGKTDVLQELKEKFWKTWTTGLFFWPAAQCINFSVIPPAYRTSRFMPLCSLTWTTYLCYMKELRIKKETDSSDDQQHLGVNYSKAEIRLSPEISEGFLSSNLQIRPMPVSLESRIRLSPTGRQEFNEVTISAIRQEQETSARCLHRELCHDLQCQEKIQRTSNTSDAFTRMDTCETNEFSHTIADKTKETGIPREATCVKYKQDKLCDIDGTFSEHASQEQSHSCALCNCNKHLVNASVKKGALDNYYDREYSDKQSGKLSKYFGRVACEIPERCSLDALLAQFLT